jgi:hypothetical protein
MARAQALEQVQKALADGDEKGRGPHYRRWGSERKAVPMENTPDIDDLDDPRQRIRERAAQIREHVDGVERAMGDPAGGDAMWSHLDQLQAVLLRFEGDVRFLALKLKGHVIQDGKISREG